MNVKLEDGFSLPTIKAAWSGFRDTALSLHSVVGRFVQVLYNVEFVSCLYSHLWENIALDSWKFNIYIYLLILYYMRFPFASLLYIYAMRTPRNPTRSYQITSTSSDDQLKNKLI